MAAVIGALRAELSASVAQFAADMGKASGVVGNFASKFKAVGQKLQGVGTAMTVGITAPFVALGVASMKAATEAAQASAQVDAALKSMGDAAGRTKAQLDAAARNLMKSSLYDDDEILRKVTANMLTFGSIAGENFDKAQQAAVNLSARLGTDLQQSAIMVGKALNDPVLGLTAMRRVGIQFTKEQQDQIKAMVAVGNVAGAQAIMLKELEHQFGGAAKAMRDATPGADLKNAWDDFQETIGAFANKVLPPLTAALSGLLNAFNMLPAPVQAVVVVGAALLAALGPILTVIGTLMTLVAGVPAVMGAMAAGIALVGPAITAVVGILSAAGPAIGVALTAMTGPIGIVIAIVAALIAVWVLFGDDIKRIVGEAFTFLDSMFGGRLTQILEAAKALFMAWWEQIKLVFKLFGQLITGDFAGALTTMGEIWRNGWAALAGIIEAIMPGIIGQVKALYDGIKQWLGDKLAALFDAVRQKVQAVGDAFRNLYNQVVGRSYVPDMVDGIESEFGRLDSVMVKPAEDAANSVGSTFKSMADQVGQGLADMLVHGELSLKNLRNLASNVAQSLFVQPFTQQLGGAFSSIIQGLGGSLFGGFRAGGGSIMAGKSYVVGENGPEVFHASTSGQIDANSGGGAMRGATVIQNIMVKDADSFRKSKRQIAGDMKRAVSFA